MEILSRAPAGQRSLVQTPVCGTCVWNHNSAFVTVSWVRRHPLMGCGASTGASVALDAIPGDAQTDTVVVGSHTHTQHQDVLSKEQHQDVLPKEQHQDVLPKEHPDVTLKGELLQKDQQKYQQKELAVLNVQDNSLVTVAKVNVLLTPTAQSLVGPFPHELRSSQHYTGRMASLEELHSALLPTAVNSDHFDRLRVAMIHGKGGAGKTELAAQFASRFEESYPAGIFFVSTNMVVRSELGQMQSLARALKLPSDVVVGAGADALQHAARKKLCTNHGWLLVIDDADEVLLEEWGVVPRYFLPPVTARGHVVITSRMGGDACGALGLATTVAIGTLTQYAAETLLVRESVPDALSEEAAAVHVAQLDTAECDALTWLTGSDGLASLPIALVLAARCIKKRKMSFAEYRTRFEDCWSELCRDEKVASKEAGGTSSGALQKNVLTACVLSFQQLKNESPAAAELFELCAVLATESMPLYLITWLKASGEGSEMFGTLIAQLDGASDREGALELLIDLVEDYLLFVRDGGTHSGVSVHSLVKEAQRQQIEAREGLVEAAARLLAPVLAAALPSMRSVSSGELAAASEQATKLMPHAAELVRVERLVGGRGWLPAQLHERMAQVYQAHLELDAAAQSYSCLLTIYETAHESEHTMVANTLARIGDMLGKQGRLEEAMERFERALAIQEVNESGHPEVAVILNHIGDVLEQQGRQEKAMEQYEHALAIHEAIGSGHSVDEAMSLTGVGRVLEQLGQLEESLERYSQVLAIKEVVFGSDHTEVAITLSSIGNVLGKQGKLGEAMQQYERALTILEAAHGWEHAEVATTLTNMGIVLGKQGWFGKAMKRFERALAIDEAVNGSVHTEVAITLTNMGHMLRKQGQLVEAMARFERALAIREAINGNEHPEVAVALTNMAIVLRKQGRLSEAMERNERALAIYSSAGSEHEGVAASTLTNMGNLLRQQDRMEEAMKLYERALTIKEATHGSEHPHTLHVKGSLKDVRRLSLSRLSQGDETEGVNENEGGEVAGAAAV